MLSFCELERAARIVDADFGDALVEKIVEPSAHRIQLTLYARGMGEEGSAKRHLVLCCAPRFGRISERTRAEKAPESPPKFSQFLRSRLRGGRLRGARIEGVDRQLALMFEGSEGRFELLLALMGNRSNLYLLDDERRVCAAQRPFEQTRRTLSVGSPWEDPPPPESGRVEGEDRWVQTGDAVFLKAIEEHYHEAEGESESVRLAQRVGQVLRKEVKLARRRLERIESELAEADDANRLQREGELLKGCLAEVPAGASEFQARDYETGDTVTISLDSTRSPQENLKAIFKRYQKLVRRLTKAGGQFDAAHDRHASLQALQAELESVPEGEVESFSQRDDIRALLQKHAPTKKEESLAAEPPRLPAALRGVERRLRPRRYESQDGLEIWVGRNDAGNDHLSTRLARGNDLFFHLDGAPGSHVVLRTGGRNDPPPDSLLDAAELAVHFSKARNASNADVHIVPIKQVKKPKGAKKGLVLVTGGRSLHLRREAARLERVLGSRIED